MLNRQPTEIEYKFTVKVDNAHVAFEMLKNPETTSVEADTYTFDLYPADIPISTPLSPKQKQDILSVSRSISVNENGTPLLPFYYGDDLYFDDEQGTLRVNGYFLRCRTSEGTLHLTLKQIKSQNGENGPVVRTEIEIALENINPAWRVDSEDHSLETITNIINQALNARSNWPADYEDCQKAAVILDSLQQLGEVNSQNFLRQHRVHKDVWFQGTRIATLSLDLIRDNVRLPNGDISTKKGYHLVELELCDGLKDEQKTAAATLAKKLESMGMEPSHTSKYDHLMLYHAAVMEREIAKAAAKNHNA